MFREGLQSECLGVEQTPVSSLSGICQAGIGTYSKYARLAFWVDFSDVTLVGEDEKEKSPPQLQILTLSQN